MKDWINKIHQGDCLKVMKGIPNNTVDCIVTDPPYQLSSITKKRTDDIAVKGNDGKGNPFCRQQASKGFMGKEWDVMPKTEIWCECLRIMKPGAFAFICMTPRQDSLSLAITRLQEAGFVTGFTSIYWTYASGFPKAQNISLTIDKQECRKQLENKLGRKSTKEEFKIEWKGFRKVIGKRTDRAAKPVMNIKGGKLHASNERKNDFDNSDIMGSTSEQAKDFEGSYGGYQPKPAVEIVLVVMKPIDEKTFTEQAMKNGKGVTWLDGGRIPYESNDPNHRKPSKTESKGKNIYFEGNVRTTENLKGGGRFPANLLVSDDILDDGKVSKSIKGDKNTEESKTNTYGWAKGGIYKSGEHYADSGQFSRYFSLDAWFKDKFKDLPPAVQKTFPFLIIPKVSKGEKNEGCEDLPISNVTETSIRSNPETADKYSANRKSKMQNIHPTVKSLKLMSYLITLGSRAGDIVLDPFLGSGTTAVSCEALNRKWIGIELNKKYAEIAQARINEEKKQLKLF